MSGQSTPFEVFGPLEKEFLAYIVDLKDGAGNGPDAQTVAQLRDAFMGGAFVVFKAGVIVVDDAGELEDELAAREKHMRRIKHELMAYSRRAAAGEVP